MNRAQRVLNILKTPLRSYNEVAQRYPFETGVVTTVVKTSAADLFAQKVSTCSFKPQCNFRLS
jgi:protein Mpv17